MIHPYLLQPSSCLKWYMALKLHFLDSLTQRIHKFLTMRGTHKGCRADKKVDTCFSTWLLQSGTETLAYGPGRCIAFGCIPENCPLDVIDHWGHCWWLPCELCSFEFAKSGLSELHCPSLSTPGLHKPLYLFIWALPVEPM